VAILGRGRWGVNKLRGGGRCSQWAIRLANFKSCRIPALTRPIALTSADYQVIVKLRFLMNTTISSAPDQSLVQLLCFPKATTVDTELV